MDNLNELTELNRELEYVFEYSFEGILLTDAKGNIVKLNDVSAFFMGLDKEEAKTKNVKELEREGVFSPSAVVQVLREEKPVELIQKGLNGRYVYVRAKPIFNKEEDLIRVISFTRDLTEIMTLRQELEEMEEELNQYKRLPDKGVTVSGIVAKSPEMNKTLQDVIRIAEIENDVLLLGETGVGKSEIAKVIHQLSNRKNKPFYVVNCATLPESLIEVELFGYTEGMFTGGVRGGKKGLFESADGGTLFLDEIGELPVQLQARLLHVLQEKKLRPVGSLEQRSVDIRIISATNRDLERRVAEGEFRDDLYHRLNIFPVTIPPLRDRREDILELAHHFVSQHNKTYGKKVDLTPGTLKTFLGYSWEGNVRELRNLLERLVVMSDTPFIKVEDLPNHMRKKTSLKEELTLKDAMLQIEKSIIIETYKQERSSYKVAERLGISQTAAYKKIRKYVNEY